LRSPSFLIGRLYQEEFLWHLPMQDSADQQERSQHFQMSLKQQIRICAKITAPSGWRSKAKSFNSQAAQRPIGHASGRMTCLSDAPVLILAAENAMAPRIAMAVRAAAA